MLACKPLFERGTLVTCKGTYWFEIPSAKTITFRAGVMGYGHWNSVHEENGRQRWPDQFSFYGCSRQHFWVTGAGYSCDRYFWAPVIYQALCKALGTAEYQPAESLDLKSGIKNDSWLMDYIGGLGKITEEVGFYPEMKHWLCVSWRMAGWGVFYTARTASRPWGEEMRRVCGRRSVISMRRMEANIPATGRWHGTVRVWTAW